MKLMNKCQSVDWSIQLISLDLLFCCRKANIRQQRKCKSRLVKHKNYFEAEAFGCWLRQSITTIKSATRRIVISHDCAVASWKLGLSWPYQIVQYGWLMDNGRRDKITTERTKVWPILTTSRWYLGYYVGHPCSRSFKCQSRIFGCTGRPTSYSERNATIERVILRYVFSCSRFRAYMCVATHKTLGRQPVASLALCAVSSKLPDDDTADR